MKPSSRRARSSSSFTTSVTHASPNVHSTPHPQPKHHPIPTQPAAAAVKIQSAYRSHFIRTLVKKISAVNSEATRLERLIQRQETVDAIRTNDRERIKVNEALMGLLLRLDEVPGVDPTVRELRRRVSHRVVGLQEILDAVSDAKVDYFGCGFLRSWDEVLEKIEEDVCRERGGQEMERFCAENLGFRCLQRFLRDQCLSTAAFALRHAFLAIRKPRVPAVAVTFLDTLGPRRAAPQAPRHAPQNRHARRAVVLEPVQYAVPALAAVRCAAQRRRAHDPHRDQQQNKQGCCCTGVLHFLLHLYHRESKGLFANGNNTHIFFSFYMQRGDGSVNCEIHQNF
ncbi:hypothetical protein RHSIM_RhsimUnG0109500 [Rhododendron simsii]|uniref:BAG domain-containing protein n=1 Tax=Rhododendron simsii TaxID=118357 RepID=A0A834L4W1_RHOSS|nr:hypothetical protein RHSIM_RhsimUnG0109500 [Rhododendron simsii]